MTLSLHKLWAGSGYEYLTRQVARLDATHQGTTSLTSYYSERGESPGQWVGSGLVGVEGLEGGGDIVTAEQMRLLFGQGKHPLADTMIEAAQAAGAGPETTRQTGLLGAPFRARSVDGNDFEIAVRLRLMTDDFGTADTGARRAMAVSAVAAERFRKEYGRSPAGSRELAGAVARWSKVAQPVAGFDLTFSPVKSVSALWAIAPPHIAAQIERCHQTAVADALRFVEERALFTREGARGVRQVEVTGLVGAAFTHRDSRAGDPDLHTHVAVANKVQTLAGKWLAIDARVLYAATVAASETYNTAIERHLGDRLGLRFAERPSRLGGERGRPVREIVGVPPGLLDAWSSRRHAIDVRQAELARDFQRRTGRPPTRKEAWQLAQQATLDTRQAKHEPRTLEEQRSTWALQARQLLGSSTDVEAMIAAVFSNQPDAPTAEVGAAWIAQAAAEVVHTMEGERATWGVWHLRAEAQRRVRTLEVPPGLAGHIVDLVVGEAANRCVPLTGPPSIEVPASLQRSDGSSVYEVSGSRSWTSARIVAAEKTIVNSASSRDGRRLDSATVDVAVELAVMEGRRLNSGQVGLVRDLGCSGARVQLALAPAGTGKTTAMRVLAAAWSSAGGSVVGLAPSASAASVLGEELGAPTDTLAKLVWSLEHPTHEQPSWLTDICARSLVIVDEAGLADSPSLARAIEHVLGRGGSVRLIGDDRQLGAVGAGGVLRDLALVHGAARLEQVLRFVDPAEAAASLALRDGRAEAIGFYLDQQRVHVGDSTTTVDQLFTAWIADRDRCLDSLMLAPTRTLVALLNDRARQARLQYATSTTSVDGSRRPEPEVTLADDNRASVGDVVITRSNNRRVKVDSSEPGPAWVRNGDRWIVDRIHNDGRLTVRSLRRPGSVILPSEYVCSAVELGYATTIHAAQGVTADTVHGLLSGRETRPELYTLLTRGRISNHTYLQLDPDSGAHELMAPGSAPLHTAAVILERILGRDSEDQSAIGYRQMLHDPVLRLPEEIDRYLDGLHAAAEQIAPRSLDPAIAATAEHLCPGLTGESAWPSLRSQLLLDAARGRDPLQRITLAIALLPGDMPGVVIHDKAAYLCSRLRSQSDSGLGARVPWIAGIPTQLLDHPQWGSYLQARAALIEDLADRVAHDLGAVSPPWISGLGVVADRLAIQDVGVWRAAHRIPATDSSLLGPPPPDGPARDWYDRLALRTSEPADHLRSAAFGVLPKQSDPFHTSLEQRLGVLANDRVDVLAAVEKAAKEGPLPDDHASAALWWRLHRYLPAGALQASGPPRQVSPGSEPLTESMGTLPLTANPSTPNKELELALVVGAMLRLTRPRPTVTAPPSAVSREQRLALLSVNNLSLAYYRARYRGSWAATYLASRCGSDLAGDERFYPGYAPAGWTRLVDHLRSLGVSDQDMLTAGVARLSRHGRLVDLFRDRLVLPIRNTDHEVVAFVARRNEDIAPDVGERSEARDPKYLNTATTPLYTKSQHLYGADLLNAEEQWPSISSDPFRRNDQVRPVPVLVEGPLDAIAVSLADQRKVGVATLGTAMSERQAALLAKHGVDPIVAMDPDSAGRAAAERAFWPLTKFDLDPHSVALPAGIDPADLYLTSGADELRQHLSSVRPLGEVLIEKVGQAEISPASLDHLLGLAAARPPQTWGESLQCISLIRGVEPTRLRERFLAEVRSTATDARSHAGSTEPTRSAPRSTDHAVDHESAAASPRRNRRGMEQVR